MYTQFLYQIVYADGRNRITEHNWATDEAHAVKSFYEQHEEPHVAIVNIEKVEPEAEG